MIKQLNLMSDDDQYLLNTSNQNELMTTLNEIHAIFRKHPDVRIILETDYDNHNFRAVRLKKGNCELYSPI
jgi:hypothetical protein